MASRGVNKVILVGNLGQDPEVRYMPNGGAVANITLATSESWRDKATGEMKERLGSASAAAGWQSVQRRRAVSPAAVRSGSAV